MRKLLFLFVLLSGCLNAQSINDFQYVLVPSKFEFSKKIDEYGLNTLTKLLLEKYGFKAFLSNEEIPSDLKNLRCNFLYASIEQDNSIFMTRIKLVLKDCKELVIFQTPFGSSRDKQFGIAYNQAFRDAAKSFDNLNYKYNGEADNKMGTEEKIQSSKVSISSLNYNEVTPIKTPLGFNLLSSDSKVVYNLLQTSVPQVYLATRENLNGIFYSKEAVWYFDYYLNDTLFSEKVAVKF